MNENRYGFNISMLKQPNELPPQTIRTFERADMSADQVDVYDKVMDWHRDVNARQYLKLGGYAGTGKTTLIAALARDMESQGERIAYAAFTGKAVNVMSRKLRAAGIHGECSTLHSLMYKPKTSTSGAIEGWEKVPALPASMIVVDEASMVGRELWEDLVSYDLPILAVGDHGQLPPVGDQVVNLMSTPDLRLERIHRQAEGNPILALAQWVRDGKSHKQYQPTDSRVSFVNSFAEIAPTLAADPDNCAAICYTNRTRVGINAFVRKLLGRSVVYPTADDTVICLRNQKPIFNGMRGKLALMETEQDKWSNAGVVINFPDDNLQLSTRLLTRQFGNPKTFDKLDSIIDNNGRAALSWRDIGMLFDYGYAMTCHKAQGSQFRDVVIFYENLFRDTDTRNRWMYTAVTRAAERLFIVRPQ